MQNLKFIRVILFFSLLFAGVFPVAAKDEAFVIEEKGRRTLKALFEKRFDSSAEQWEYAQELRNKGKLRRADKSMLYLVRRWPNSLEAPRAQRARADMLWSRDKGKDAFKEYQYLIDNYASRMRDYDGVLQSQFDIAVKEMNRRRMRWLFKGFRAPEKAVEYFEETIRNGPQWERAPEAQYMIGQAYQEADELELAVAAYSVLDYRYPQSTFSEDGMYQKVMCLDRLRKEYPYSEETMDKIVTSTTVFLGTFPGSERREEIIQLRNRLYESKAKMLFDQAKFYEKVPEKPESALIYYRLMVEQYPKSKLVGDANEQILRLEALTGKDEKKNGAPEEPAVEDAESSSTVPSTQTTSGEAFRGMGNLADTFSGDDALEINADRLEYSNNTIYATGSVTGQYSDITLMADQVSANPESGDLHMEGNIFFSQGATYWQGESLDYNFKKKVGELGPSNMYFDPAFVSAESVKRVSTNEFLLEGASFTTCPRTEPHIHARAKEARLINENYIKAKGLTFYVGKVPVMYLPYWERRLEDRIFTVWTGYSSDMGAFVLTETQLPITDHIDSKTRLDYRTERGVGVGQGFDWAYPNARGEILGYYLNDRDPYDSSDTATDRELIDNERYRVKLEHKQNFTDTHYFKTEWNYISDPDVLDDFFNREYRDAAQPENYASWVYGTDSFGAELLASKELNDFYNNVDRIGPTLDLYRMRIPGTPLYLKSENNVSYLEQVYSSVNNVDEDYDSVRFDSANTVFLPLRFGALNVIPRSGYRATYYTDSQPLDDENDEMRHIFEAGAETSIAAYKTLSQRSGFYGDGIRHKFEPYADYSYRLNPTVSPKDLYQFDEVDLLDERNDVRLGLRNVLQTKRRQRNAYIVDLDLFTYYRFDHPASQENFDYLYADARVPLKENLSLDFEGAYDWYSEQIELADTRLRYSHEDFIASVSHRYRDDAQSLWTPRISLFPNRKISFDAFARYEEEDSEWEEIETMVYYSYCCMRYGLGYQYYDDDHRVWLTFTLDAFRDKGALSFGR